MTVELEPTFGTNPFVAAVQWLNGTLLGSVATAVAVIAVAACGLLLLRGRVDFRRGAQVIFGCFILFGASSIAAGIMNAKDGSAEQVDQAPVTPEVLPISPAYPPAQPGTLDPYAGAALPTQR